MSMSKKYWRGLPELHNSPEFQAQSKNELLAKINSMMIWLMNI